MKHVLATERLTLREMALDDLDFVAAMLDHPEVMRFYPKRYTRDEARAWIERQVQRYAEHGHGFGSSPSAARRHRWARWG